MNPIGIFKKDYVVGLDIGTSSMKVAQFAIKEDGLRLVKTELVEKLHSKDEASREKDAISALKNLLRGVDIKRSKFVVSINSPKTCIRRVIAPHIPKGELAEGVKLEAKNYFPFAVDDALLDFEIAGDVMEKGVRKYQLLVATTSKKTVAENLSLLGKLGIKPSSFIPVPSALRNIIEAAHPKKDEVKAILDIGEELTDLSIVKGADLVFSRKIPVAGGGLTSALTGVLVSDKGKMELSQDEAEKIKREIGIPPKDEPKTVGDRISTTQIMSLITAPLQHLVSEIDRCFDYYREETGGGKVDLLLLFGGGASLGGLTGFLSEEVGVNVKLGNPSEGLKVDAGAIKEDRLSPRLAPAIGAGLNKEGGLNLLPPEIKEETERTFKRAALQAFITAFILIPVLVYIGMKIQLNNFEKRIAVGKFELKSLQHQVRRAEARHLANKLLSDEPYWEDVFRELSNLIPDNIRLTGLGMNDSVITMKGIVESEDGERLISNFILTLEEGIFKEVKLINTRDLKEETGSEFELRCRVD